MMLVLVIRDMEEAKLPGRESMRRILNSTGQNIQSNYGHHFDIFETNRVMNAAEAGGVAAELVDVYDALNKPYLGGTNSRKRLADEIAKSISKMPHVHRFKNVPSGVQCQWCDFYVSDQELEQGYEAK